MSEYGGGYYERTTGAGPRTDKAMEYLGKIGHAVTLGQLKDEKWKGLKQALGLAVLVIAVVLLVMFLRPMVSGYLVSGTGSNNAGFFSSPSDMLKVSGFADAERIAKQRWAARNESFTASRESPAYHEYAPSMIRHQDREHAAVRAFNKINQERSRRTTGDKPLEWDEFYRGWKSSHPSEDDHYKEAPDEGFEDFDARKLIPY